MILRRALFVTLLTAALAATVSARAEDPAVGAAEAASAALRAAIADLRTAEKGRDRVAALSRTIGAYEDGLSVMRDSLRRIAVREEQLTERLARESDRVVRVLGAMSAIGSTPSDALLFHPDGATSTARAGMILSSVAPALQAEASKLKTDLDELSAIRRIREDSAGTLQEGLDAAQAARTALSQAMQDRTGLPTRFIDVPEELKTLVASVETLDALARGLSTLESDIGPPRLDFPAARGTLPLPVRGTLLRKSGEADAAGIRRPGLVIATEPSALVTAPWPATVRYRGPLLDYGNVMILEPADSYLLVLAGLGTVFGETGDVLDAGAPVGLMPGETGVSTPVPAGGEPDAGVSRSETLYMELRQRTEPIDPGPWFVETKDD